MRGLLRPGVVAVLAMSLCSCVLGNVATQSLPPQTLDTKTGTTFMTSGNLDGSPFVLLTSVRLFQRDNAVALCAGTRLLASRDLSPQIRTALAADKSVLTLKRADGQSMTLSPEFVPVTYQAVPASPDGSIAFVPKDVGEAQGGCVSTSQGWQAQWGGKVDASLALYAAMTRKRTQTVVGATP